VEIMREHAERLLGELRALVDECRDSEVPDFFHDTGRAAYFAAAFNALDGLLTSGQAAAPGDWRAATGGPDDDRLNIDFYP
jgi:hypothetical protein